MTTKRRVDELRRGDHIVLMDFETFKRGTGTVTYVGERLHETAKRRRDGETVPAWIVFYTTPTGGERGQLFAADDQLEIP